MTRIACLFALGLLSACTPAPGTRTGGAQAGGPYAFEVELTLTLRAIEKLDNMREMVTVSGLYWGEPAASGRARADGMGRINLGADDIRIRPASRLVRMPGAAIDLKVLAGDVEGPAQVIVHVYSSRMAHEANLLACGGYEGPVTMARQKPVDIRCDLAGPAADVPAAAVLANPR